MLYFDNSQFSWIKLNRIELWIELKMNCEYNNNNNIIL